MPKTLWCEDKDMLDVLANVTGVVGPSNGAITAITNLFEDITCLEEEIVLLRAVHYHARGVMRFDGVDMERAGEYFKTMSMAVHAVNAHDQDMSED